MAINDVYALRVDMSGGGADWAFVLHVQQLDADGVEDPLVSCSNGFESQIIPALLACWSDEVTHYNVNLRRVLPTPTQGRDVAAGPSVGTIAHPTLPAADCVIVRTYTAVASRRGRGRIKFSGIAISDVTRGVLSQVREGAIQAAWVTFYTSWIDGASAIHWQGVIYSKADNVARPTVEVVVLPAIRRQSSRSPS